MGTQLSWSLRPFIGAKGLPFQFFRQQEGNFYQAVLLSTEDMLDGKSQKRKSDKVSLPEQSETSADTTTVKSDQKRQE